MSTGLEIWTDCSPTFRGTGWAAEVAGPEPIFFCGWAKRMKGGTSAAEEFAILQALRIAISRKADWCVVYSDSKNVTRNLTLRHRQAANHDVRNQVDRALSRISTPEFRWVRRCTTDPSTNVDLLACWAVSAVGEPAGTQSIDLGFGRHFTVNFVGQTDISTDWTKAVRWPVQPSPQ